MEMNAGRFFASLILVCLLTSGQAFACAPPTDSLPKGQCLLPQTVRKSSKNIFLASPTASYSPETSISFGLYGLYYFKLGAKGGCTRPSRIEMSTAYTLKKQFWVEPKWEVFFKEDSYILRGRTLYQKYNENFFGVGNETKDEDAELYSHQLVFAHLTMQKRLFAHFFAGPAYHVEYMFDIEAPETGILHDGLVAGTSGGIASGAGVDLSWDSRDLTLTPSRGFYTDVTTLFFQPAFGSEYRFDKYIIDVRKYFPLFQTHVFAVQSYIQHNTNEPPFRMLAMVGGNQLLRGFYTGRFRDRDLLLLQAEYRLPLFWRIGMTVFGGAAEVSHSFSDLYLQGFHYNYGLGLRYMYDRKERINIRVDFGFGKNTNGQYITVGEAF